jgi:hypothetical protein
MITTDDYTETSVSAWHSWAFRLVVEDLPCKRVTVKDISLRLVAAVVVRVAKPGHFPGL